MTTIYKFSFIPVAPAWSDPFDASIQQPAKRLGEHTMTVAADDEQTARKRLVEQYTEDEKGHTLEDVKLLEVFTL